MFEKITNWWNGKSISAVVLNWCSRHLTAVSIVLLGLYIFAWERELIRVSIMILILGALVPLVANISLYIYTKFKFARVLSMGEDERMNQAEQGSFSRVLSGNILGAWLFVAIVGAISIYYQSDKIQGDEAKIDASTISVDTMAIRKAIVEDKITSEIQSKILDSIYTDTVKK